MKKAKLSEVVKILKLEVINKSSDFDELILETSNMNRPGMQFFGYMKDFPYERLQIIGKVEHSYYETIKPKMRYTRLKPIFEHNLPAIIFARNLPIYEDIIQLSKDYDKTILRSALPTTKLQNKMSEVIEDMLSKKVNLHGVFVDVYGIGVLIIGPSAIGKSETALDLINRGHRLIADDRVNIKVVDTGLVGESPENIRHFMEIRGLGILNIRRLYGLGSVKDRSHVELIVKMEHWDSEKEYERLGLDDEYMYILDKKIPMVSLPVKVGRNLALIIETSARNQRQKNMGVNSAVELHDRLMNGRDI